MKSISTERRTQNSIATKWLMRAVGTGAVAAIAYEFTGWGASGFFPHLWLSDQPSSLVSYWLQVVPSLLLLLAWIMTAREESRQGVHAQGRVMGVVAVLAIIVRGFSPPFGLATIYGLALLLLAARTQDYRTAACGILALLAIPFASTGGWAFLAYLFGLAILMFISSESQARQGKLGHNGDRRTVARS